LVGELASHLAGGYGGFLAGLGFPVADKMFEIKGEGITKALLRLIEKD